MISVCPGRCPPFASSEDRRDSARQRGSVALSNPATSEAPAPREVIPTPTARHETRSHVWVSGNRSLFLLFAACLLVPRTGVPQGLTGTLIGTVKDQQGGALPGAQVILSSPALIGGAANLVTNERGSCGFGLASRLYALEIGWMALRHRETEVSLGAGATIERVGSPGGRGRSPGRRSRGGLARRGQRQRLRDALWLRLHPGHPGTPVQPVRFVKVAPGVSPTS